MGWLSPTASTITLPAGIPALIRAWATALARCCDFWKITSRCRSTDMLPVRLEEWPTTLTVPVPPLALKAATAWLICLRAAAGRATPSPGK